MSEESDKVIHVYSTNPALQRFNKVKIVQTMVNQSILEKIFNKEAPIDGMKHQSHGSQLKI